MDTLTTNLRGVSISQKVLRGRVVIELQTNNPNVPGNGAALADFAVLQRALEETRAAAVAAQSAARAATLAQNLAERAWDKGFGHLGCFTLTATGGVAAKILSAGFGVKGKGSPIPVPGMVAAIIVRLGKAPGHSKLRWKAVPGAQGYLVQGSANPADERSWTEPTFAMSPKCEANGAVPGQPYWYRVAAFNSAGQGPWSMPAARPVM